VAGAAHAGADGYVPGRAKKSLTAAGDDLARRGLTSDLHLAAILQAQAINRQSGGALVGPWDLDQLPEEWLMAYQELQLLPQKQQEIQRLEAFFDEFERKHPTFRKYGLQS
jgi:hypothetical protein